MRNKETYYHTIGALQGVTDLPNGVNPTDAVNVSQLSEAISNIPEVDLTPYLTIESAEDTYQPIGNYLTKTETDGYYYPLNTNPLGYLTASSLPNLTPYQLRSEKGQSNGYAPLNTNSLVPTANLPVAAGTIEGIVSNTTQTFNGQKTFAGNMYASNIFMENPSSTFRMVSQAKSNNALAVITSTGYLYTYNNLWASDTGGIKIGNFAFNSASILTAESTTKGFLMPFMTQAQREAIVLTGLEYTPLGLKVYQTDGAYGNYTWHGSVIGWKRDISEVSLANYYNKTESDGRYITIDSFNAGLATKQNNITLTNTGIGGTSTLLGSTLNIPVIPNNTNQLTNGAGFITESRLASGQTIGANTNGNAATTTKLVTPRAINGVLFDGTSDITISSGGGGTVTNVSSANSNITVTNATTTPVITLASTIDSNTTGNATTATNVNWTGVVGRPTIKTSFEITITNVDIDEPLVLRIGEGFEIVPIGTTTYTIDAGVKYSLEMNHTNFTINNVWYGDTESFVAYAYYDAEYIMYKSLHGNIKNAIDLKQSKITLTTSGTGAATLDNNILNIPTPVVERRVRQLAVFYSDVATTSADVDQVLYSYYIPANYMSTDGDRIEFEFTGLVTEGTASVAPVLNGSQFNGSGVIPTNRNFRVRGSIIRVSSTQYKLNQSFEHSYSDVALNTRDTYTTSWSQSFLYGLRATSTVAGGVKAMSGSLVFYPAPN